MGNHYVAAPLSRRSFLRTLGAVAGAAMLPGFGPFQAKASAGSLPALRGRYGLLLPESPAGDSFLNGLRLALPGQAFTVERVAMGRLSVAEGAKRLAADGHRVLVGLLGPNLATEVAVHLQGTDGTLLAIDTGANVIRTDEENAQVVTHSLGLWRGAAALGAWSAREYGPRSLMLSGIIESGYDMLHAFEVGLVRAGGSPLPAIITHLAPGAVDWQDVFRQVKAARPDVVYAVYSGSEAVEFLKAWRASGLQIPLVASPFLVDELLLPLHEGRAESIPSVASWAPSLANPVNQPFVTAYAQASGSNPDAFALLGYEAGLLMAGNLQAVEGPRGWIRPGPVGATRSPLYLRKVDGLANRVIGALPGLDESDPALASLRGAVRTGWTGPYLV